jgi:outer membrane receptor protein involved in Fe transport
VNLGTTQSKGYELDFRQRLTFLPGYLKGLYLRANYTNVRTSAVFNGLSYAPGQVVGSAGQWYVPRTYNVGLQYFYGKFGASYDVNYTAQFPIVYGLTTPGTNAFRESRILQNTGVSYQIRPEITLFLNVNNLTEANLVNYTSLESRHRLFYVMPRTLKLGMSGRF